MERTQLYNEEELLRRVAGGNEQAFSEVVDHYAPVVYAQLLVYLKDVHRAEEVSQDIFMAIWRNREKLPGMDNFPGYLYVSTRNKILTVVKERVMATEEPPEDRLHSLLTDPASAVEFKELMNSIRRGIELLPARRKEVFMLSRQENLTYDEIASRLGLSKNTVKEHISEALTFLRDYLNRGMDVILVGLLWLAMAGF
ncbi:RNA polymerase sigma-70 factor (ECF subfamily) [Filimonas zeae]|uniref:DNA-directed RNA polymerase sigma-70 factor n=1 Tax=Filimonas zeae TaxID=1737353 RepID=A0A917MTK3_9BACT|nr:RNA polymerase sigma-70 factor [Filimonas zeae]MDR6339568.1 RNA polymerase sigma-70 factor (ECF subfamily) [Filimonas zeae]GGH63008.1 DNA-directed RNA polymerase sigma-70 factor [Filimonas zeae]